MSELNRCCRLRAPMWLSCAINASTDFWLNETEILILFVIFDWVFCDYSQIDPDIKIICAFYPPRLFFSCCLPTAKEALLAIFLEKWFTSVLHKVLLETNAALDRFCMVHWNRHCFSLSFRRLFKHMTEANAFISEWRFLESFCVKFGIFCINLSLRDNTYLDYTHSKNLKKE